MTTVVEGRRDLPFGPINEAIKVFRKHEKVKAHDKTYRAALRQIIDFRDLLHARYNLGNVAPQVAHLTEPNIEALDRLAREFLGQITAKSREAIDALSEVYVLQFRARAIQYSSEEAPLLKVRRPIKNLSFRRVDDAIRKFQTPVIFHNLNAEEKRRRSAAHQEAMQRIILFRDTLYDRYYLPQQLFTEFGDKKGETLQALTESNVEAIDGLARSFFEELEEAQGIGEGGSLNSVQLVFRQLGKVEALSKKYIVAFCDRAAVYSETEDRLLNGAPTLMERVFHRKKLSQAELLEQTAEQRKLDEVAQAYGMVIPLSPRGGPTSPRSPIRSAGGPQAAAQDDD